MQKLTIRLASFAVAPFAATPCGGFIVAGRTTLPDWRHRQATAMAA